jgi:hypothetical protein
LYILIREASNLLYSRLRITKEQLTAKAEIVYFLRESRHFNISVGMDTQKATSIDADVRNVLDFIVLKRWGGEVLQDFIIKRFQEYEDYVYYMYGYDIEVNKQYVYTLDPNEYLIIPINDVVLSKGTFDMPPWHKLENEDIIEQLDFKIVEIEPIHYYKSEKLHTRIIELSIEGMKPKAVGETLALPPKIVEKHLDLHIKEVSEYGYCRVCKSYNMPLSISSWSPLELTLKSIKSEPPKLKIKVSLNSLYHFLANEMGIDDMEAKIYSIALNDFITVCRKHEFEPFVEDDFLKIVMYGDSNLVKKYYVENGKIKVLPLFTRTLRSRFGVQISYPELISKLNNGFLDLRKLLNYYREIKREYAQKEVR